MKTRRLKIVMPFIVFMLAVLSAFAFKKDGDRYLLAPETGWINLPDQPCAIQVQCDTTPSPFVCTAIYNGIMHQALGKTSEYPPVCNKILYRPFW